MVSDAGVRPAGAEEVENRRPKRSGKGFFLTLLIASGVVILLLFFFFFMGRQLTVFTFKKFVVNKAFVGLLPKEYTLEEAEAVRREVYQFYDTAGAREVSDTDLLRVSGAMQQIMQDERITPEEINGLQELIRSIHEASGRPSE